MVVCAEKRLACIIKMKNVNEFPEGGNLLVIKHLMNEKEYLITFVVGGIGNAFAWKWFQHFFFGGISFELRLIEEIVGFHLKQSFFNSCRRDVWLESKLRWDLRFSVQWSEMFLEFNFPTEPRRSCHIIIRLDINLCDSAIEFQWHGRANRTEVFAGKANALFAEVSRIVFKINVWKHSNWLNLHFNLTSQKKLYRRANSNEKRDSLCWHWDSRYFMTQMKFSNEGLTRFNEFSEFPKRLSEK